MRSYTHHANNYDARGTVRYVCVDSRGQVVYVGKGETEAERKHDAEQECTCYPPKHTPTVRRVAAYDTV